MTLTYLLKFRTLALTLDLGLSFKDLKNVRHMQRHKPLNRATFKNFFDE